MKLLLLKSHIDTYTRKDGATVTAHDDKRVKAGDVGHHEQELYGRHYKQFDKVEAHDGTVHTVLNHTGPEVTTYGGASFHPTKVKPAKDWRDEENWHTRTMSKMRTHSMAELHGIRRDASEAAEVGEKAGHSSDKTGKYRDEAHYAGMEITRRQKG